MQLYALLEEGLNEVKQGKVTPMREAIDSIRSSEAFTRLSKYHKSLPADFDYQKELAEYREERFGNSG